MAIFVPKVRLKKVGPAKNKGLSRSTLSNRNVSLRDLILTRYNQSFQRQHTSLRNALGISERERELYNRTSETNGSVRFNNYFEAGLITLSHNLSSLVCLVQREYPWVFPAETIDELRRRTNSRLPGRQVIVRGVRFVSETSDRCDHISLKIPLPLEFQTKEYISSVTRYIQKINFNNVRNNVPLFIKVKHSSDFQTIELEGYVVLLYTTGIPISEEQKLVLCNTFSDAGLIPARLLGDKELRELLNAESVSKVPPLDFASYHDNITAYTLRSKRDKNSFVIFHSAHISINDILGGRLSAKQIYPEAWIKNSLNIPDSHAGKIEVFSDIPALEKLANIIPEMYCALRTLLRRAAVQDVKSVIPISR